MYTSSYNMTHLLTRANCPQLFAWWAKYNYILAAALDTGTALSGILIFFALSYPGY